MNFERRLAPIERSCYWLARRQRLDDPPLEGRVATDVAIVGAGYTGLWTALALKDLDPGTDVAVLEQGSAAYGASGRNAGMVGEGIDHSHDLAIRHFGREEAARLARIGVDNLDAFARFLHERRIDCDFERTGQLTVALLPEHLDDLRAAEAAARSLGVAHVRLLNAAETRAELNCARFRGGLLNPRCGILDPVRLVEGLKREAERLGVRFYERTRVASIDPDGAGLRVRCAAGEARARRVVLATNAYTHTIVPRLASRFLPLYDYILVSDPLTPDQKGALGWRNRRSVLDARTFFKYYRLTADDRVLFGTSEAAYYPRNRVDEGCDHSPRHYAALRESFKRHFPALASLEFPYAWGGPICSTTRFTPFFGSARGGRLLYGLGYTGHGISTSRLAGRILACMALSRHDPLLNLRMVRRKPPPFPPEPLRALAVRAVTKALRHVDEGGRPGLLLRLLDALGIGLSS